MNHCRHRSNREPPATNTLLPAAHQSQQPWLQQTTIGGKPRTFQDRILQHPKRQGRISGYTTGIGHFAHSVAETNDDLAALIGAAEEFSGPGFLVPLRNTELLRWCLQHDLRVVYMGNLMTIGLYQEPRGAFLPSILY